MNEDTLKLLVGLSALGCYGFWTAAYVLVIRQGFKEKTFCMPVVAVCLNVGWEVMVTFFLNFPQAERIGNALWLGADLVIFYTCLKFGPGDFKNPQIRKWLTPMAVVGMIALFFIQWAFVTGFDDEYAVHSGWFNAFLIWVLYIGMFWRRESTKGQSIYIALCILLGNIFTYIEMTQGVKLNPMPLKMPLINLLFAAAVGLNLFYIALYTRQCRAEGVSPWKR